MLDPHSSPPQRTPRGNAVLVSTPAGGAGAAAAEALIPAILTSIRSSRASAIKAQIGIKACSGSRRGLCGLEP